MEDDRAQTDLGIAADIEEAQAPEPVQRQPKKRFVGRRKAAEGARNGGAPSVEDSGAIQGQSAALVFQEGDMEGDLNVLTKFV